MQALCSLNNKTTGRSISRFWSLAPLLMASLSGLYLQSPAMALETSPAVTAPSNSEFNLDAADKGHEGERETIKVLLTDIENQWNAHDIEKVMAYYADDYVNNDGLDKVAVKEITQDFWKNNPDAKSSSITTQIRIEGNFATVESRDTAYGTIQMNPMHESQLKGELNTVSGGQLYLKKYGDTWKITGDRIDYELVKVTYGVAKNLKISFTAPEQVKSGRQFSAKIEVDLPSNYLAVGSITRQALEYPQHTPKDLWRAMESPTLERLMFANTSNKNELLMATVIITDINKRNLAGIELLTRRLNVVPETGEPGSKTQTAAVDQSLGYSKITKPKFESKE